MPKLELLNFNTPKIEIRQEDNERPRIIGMLMRYGAKALDRMELFREASLSWPEDGIILNHQHDRSKPILRFVPVVQNRMEIHIDAEVPDTTNGRDAVESLRAGIYTGLSVEFWAKNSEVISGVRCITEADLFAVALVDQPSYETQVDVRENHQPTRRRLWL